MKLKLEIEPIPISNWGISLATRLSKEKWDKIRHKCYLEADYKCEICGRIDDKFNAHEVWRFEEKKRIQRLVKVECLCGLCHGVKHFGRSSEVYGVGYLEDLVKHWCQVNGKQEKDFYIYLRQIRELNRKRADRRYRIIVGRRELI